MLATMYSTRDEAEERYAGYRDAVYHHVYENWAPMLQGVNVDLRLFPISEDALQQCEELWQALATDPRSAPFPWRRIVNFERRVPRRFELAIWNGSVLCGLTLGRASRSNSGADSNVTITFLQGAPQGINKLKGYIAPIALDAAVAYATLLERPMVYIKEPLPGVRPYYEEFDFKVAKRRCNGLYLGKKIQE